MGGSVGKDGDNNQDNKGTSNSTNIFTYSSLLNNTRLNCMGPFTDRFFFSSRNKVLYHLQFVESRNTEPQIKRGTVKVYSDFLPLEMSAPLITVQRSILFPSSIHRKDYWGAECIFIMYIEVFSLVSSVAQSRPTL